jgi:hypothetical protein
MRNKSSPHTHGRSSYDVKMTCVRNCYVGDCYPLVVFDPLQKDIVGRYGQACYQQVVSLVSVHQCHFFLAGYRSQGALLSSPVSPMILSLHAVHLPRYQHWSCNINMKLRLPG